VCVYVCVVLGVGMVREVGCGFIKASAVANM